MFRIHTGVTTNPTTWAACSICVKIHNLAKSVHVSNPQRSHLNIHNLSFLLKWWPASQPQPKITSRRIYSCFQHRKWSSQIPRLKLPTQVAPKFTTSNLLKNPLPKAVHVFQHIKGSSQIPQFELPASLMAEFTTSTYENPLPASVHVSNTRMGHHKSHNCEASCSSGAKIHNLNLVTQGRRILISIRFNVFLTHQFDTKAICIHVQTFLHDI